MLLVILSSILDRVEDLGPVRAYLPTHYLGAWLDAINDPIVWDEMARGVVVSVAYSAVLLALAWPALPAQGHCVLRRGGFRGAALPAAPIRCGAGCASYS